MKTAIVIALMALTFQSHAGGYPDLTLEEKCAYAASSAHYDRWKSTGESVPEAVLVRYLRICINHFSREQMSSLSPNDVKKVMTQQVGAG